MAKKNKIGGNQRKNRNTSNGKRMWQFSKTRIVIEKITQIIITKKPC